MEHCANETCSAGEKDYFQEPCHMEPSFSCHLQEVEKILERITSTNAQAQQTRLASQFDRPSKCNERKFSAPIVSVGSSANKWRDYLANVGGVLGFASQKSLENNSRIIRKSSMMSGEKANNEKPTRDGAGVTRSQSMRYYGQQIRPYNNVKVANAALPRDIGEDDCQPRRGRVNSGTPLIAHASPSRSCKSPVRKMESNSTEFRRRTNSIPDRQSRRSQSMRIPNKPHIHLDKSPNTQSDADDEFERMRTFCIDPTKPGLVINRGDSFRRRAQIGNVLKAKQSSDKLEIPTNSQGSSDTNLASERSVSPMTPINPETFLTPPESMTPFANGQSPPSDVKKYTVVVIGLEGVGKTSMINQFMTSDYCNPFQSDAMESEADRTVIIQLDGEESQLSFIEIDNKKDESWLTTNGHGYLIVYSIADALSFRNAKHLVQAYRRQTSTLEKPIILVANKIDLERKRQVTADDGRAVAKEHDCKFVEIAVALGHHVDQLLVGILTQVRQCELENEMPIEASNGDDVFHHVEANIQPKSPSMLLSKGRSASSNEFRLSPSRQNLNQPQNLRRASTKRRKRQSSSKTSEDSSMSPQASCSNLNAIGQRFVQKMFGRRRSSRSLEDLLSL